MMDKDKNILIVVLIAAVVLLFLFGGFGIGSYGMMGWGMGYGIVFMLLFWGLIIWVVVTLVNASQSHSKDSDDALTTLKKRYASGEITKKDYEEMKKELLK